jgi:hypothetical protein
MVIFIKDNGKMEKDMVEEYNTLQINPFIMVIGEMTR